MLSANEARKLATEKNEERVERLLQEVEKAIIEHCEVGELCGTWEAWHVPERTRDAVADVLRTKGYRVGPSLNCGLFIQW